MQSTPAQTEQQCQRPQPSIPSCFSTAAWPNQAPSRRLHNAQEYCFTYPNEWINMKNIEINVQEIV